MAKKHIDGVDKLAGGGNVVPERSIALLEWIGLVVISLIGVALLVFIVGIFLVIFKGV